MKTLPTLLTSTLYNSWGKLWYIRKLGTREKNNIMRLPESEITYLPGTPFGVWNLYSEVDNVLHTFVLELLKAIEFFVFLEWSDMMSLRYFHKSHILESFKQIFYAHPKPSRTIFICTTIGKDAPSYASVKRWVEEFKHGREGLEDDPRPGTCWKAMIQRIHNML